MDLPKDSGYALSAARWGESGEEGEEGVEKQWVGTTRAHISARLSACLGSRCSVCLY